MQSLNKVILIGQICSEVQTKAVNNLKFITFRLVTTNSWFDANKKSVQTKKEFHKIVIFNNRILENTASQLREGVNIYVEGELQTRKYTGQDNIEKSETSISIPNFKGELLILEEAEVKSNQAKSTKKTESSYLDLINDDLPF